MKDYKEILKFFGLSFLSVLGVFFVYRIIELFICSDLIKDGHWTYYPECLLRGIVFDTHCAFEALLLPYIIVSFLCMIGKLNKWVVRFSILPVIVVLLLQLNVTFANIPYLKYQLSNLTVPAVESMFNGTEVISMMFSLQYILFSLFSMIVSFGTCYLIYFLAKKYLPWDGASLKFSYVFALVVPALIYLGYIAYNGHETEKNAESTNESERGSFVTDIFANFSDDPTVNKICMNPWYSLERNHVLTHRLSMYKVDFMSDEEANYIAMRHSNYPQCVSDTATKRTPDIFFIMMESLSAHVMKTFGYEQNCTPFLDSLFGQSLSFSKIHAGGCRTNMALFASTTSQHSVVSMLMSEALQPEDMYVSRIFKDLGYKSLMFISHTSKFDKMDYFYNPGVVDRLYSFEDFGEENKTTAWGVNDGFLFDYAFRVADSLHKSDDKPVFSHILTMSNHPNFGLPNEYNGKFPTEREDAVYYSDDMVRKFYNKVRSTEWGKDAMFVIFGDHGYVVGQPECTSPCCFSHIPLIINCPGATAVKVDTTLGTEVDILPTMLSVLGQKIDNYKGMGVDLLQTDRDTIYYTVLDFSVARTKDRVFTYHQTNNYTELVVTDGICGKGEYQQDPNDESFIHFVKAHEQATYNRVILGNRE